MMMVDDVVAKYCHQYLSNSQLTSDQNLVLLYDGTLMSHSNAHENCPIYFSIPSFQRRLQFNQIMKAERSARGN